MSATACARAMECVRLLREANASLTEAAELEEVPEVKENLVGFASDLDRIAEEITTVISGEEEVA